MAEKTKATISRRALFRTAGAAAGLVAVGGSAGEPTAEDSPAKRPRIHFRNDEFYDAAGQFDTEKGKDAIEALCRYHGYPIFPGFGENLWVSDYGTGEFTRLGLAAYLFVNNEQDRYMLLDLFLLPRQMLPEHWHVEGQENPAKREGWLVRWGTSHIVGVGERNLTSEVVIPDCHWGGKVATEHQVVATPGVFVALAEVKTRHWQFGGPQGAIVTEVANVHTGSAVRHSDPAIDRHFLGG